MAKSSGTHRKIRPFVMIVVSFVLLTGLAVPQDGSSTSQITEKPRLEQQPVNDLETIAAADAAAPDTPAPLNREKKKTAMILISAVAGIAVFGVGAIAAIMIWAAHLRRLARAVGPEQKTVGNDFWFLKPSKTVVSQSDPSNPEHPTTEK